MDALQSIAAEFVGVDARELISKMDPSEVHVNQPLRTKRSRKAMIVNTTGLGLNGLAIGAGGHALVMAGKDSRLATSTNRVARAVSAPAKAYRKTKLAAKIGEDSAFGRKYAVPLAAGAVGLHTAELVGDAIGGHALAQQRKLQTDVAKNLELIVKARAMGAVDTERALQLVEDYLETVAKGFTVKVPMSSAKKAARQAELTRRVDEVVPEAKKLLRRVGAAAAVGGAAAAGAKGQRMLDTHRDKTAAAARGPLGKSLEWTGTIAKADEDQRLVFGWASVSKIDGEAVIDRQADYVPIETTETAAYDYVLHSRKGGDMHRRVRKFDVGRDEPYHTANLVESMVVTPEKLEAWGLPADALPIGWWVGFKVEDDTQWADVKAGRRTAFSIHGMGRRVEVPEHELV